VNSSWHYGFKLHLIINDKGELLAFKSTPANTDDRKSFPERKSEWLIWQDLIPVRTWEKAYCE
jgi:hypothetical protein